MRFTFSLARAVSLGAFLAVAALAADEPAAHFSVDRSLVLVSASVTNKADQVVTGLGKEHFRIFEDHQEQAIRHFTIEETPLSLGLVFDSSASMKSKVSEARRAAAALLGTMNRQDEAFLVEFDRHPRLVVGFTRDDALIQSRLFATKPNGSTAMLDALFLAISQIRKANNPRRALLIISDGWDNNSRYTAAEVLRAVREADVRIYAIMIEGPSLRAPSPAFGANGPDLMEELAEETGGRFNGNGSDQGSARCDGSAGT